MFARDLARNIRKGETLFPLWGSFVSSPYSSMIPFRPLRAPCSCQKQSSS